LFAEHGPPDHIRSDNGSEFTAKAVRDWLGKIDPLHRARITLARGQSVGQVCHTLGVPEQSCYRRHKEYGGLQTGQAKRLKEPEMENGRLRKAVSDLTLDKLILKEALEGNY